jgi:hypothetical protein
MLDIPQYTDLLTSLGLAQRSDLVGVPAADIQAFEQQYGLNLPQSYRLFLLHMGRSAGYLCPWMAFYFDDLSEIKEHFELLNAEQRNPVILPPQSLLIAHREAVFDYFVCAGKDDPEVYRIDLYSNCPSAAHRYASSFSQYLVKLAKSAESEEIPTDLLEEFSGSQFSDDTITY